MQPDSGFLGIDLGTSSVKVVLIDRTGEEVAKAQVHYPVQRPHAGWAEQDPATWWKATAQAVREVLSPASHTVSAVGLSGQMHGLVLLDDKGQPLRPAIIWSDGRSSAQVDEWKARIEPALVERVAGFPIATGMAGVSLTWLRDMEPDVYRRARWAVQPKDYIRYRLTGTIAIEPTDAGGSLLFDIRSGAPSLQILDAVGLRRELLPPVIPSLSVAGLVDAAASDLTGLPKGTPVAAGGGDQAMAAIALGLHDPSRAAVAISSGGTVFKRTAKPMDASHGLHVLPDAHPGEWLAMGVVLSAGLSIDWLAREMFAGPASPEHIRDLMAGAFEVSPGADGLMFSSQLGGTRTPVADEAVRGSLIGMGFRHGQAHITRAMVEGVCIALSRSLESMNSADETVEEVVISGGAARFPIWRQTLSDVTGLPVHVSSDVEHSALGAAMVAAESIGETLEIDPASRLKETVYPDARSVELYRGLAADLQSLERAIAGARTDSAVRGGSTA